MKAVVLLNGSPPEKDLILKETENADLIIAADGASDYAFKYNVMPHVVLGDMDSVKNAEMIKQAVREFKIFPREKDEIDSQLAIDMAVEKGASDIVLLGMTGGRLDHTYANLMLMLRIAKCGVKITAIDKYNEITIATGDIEIRGKAGETLSLLPIGSDVVIDSTEGLYYSVTNKAMTVDLPYGVSNVMTEDLARVKVRSGYLLVIKVLKERI